MRIHVFQHVPFEGPAAIGPWAVSRGHSLSVTRFYGGDAPPDLEGVDWLIVLGGPMGVYDEDRHPWLLPEKRWIEAAVGQGKTVLGICLGAQLLAVVLGAEVSKNREREIGWYPVELTGEALRAGPFRDLPPSFQAFHWHGDTFAIPAGAVLAARSDACDHQGFYYGQRVAALQFHLESTPESVRLLVENGAGDLSGGRFVQHPRDMIPQDGRFAELNRRMDAALRRMEQAGAS